MHFVVDLWQPILVATAFCFIASAVVWMAGPHHKTEWKAAPDQDGLMALLRKAGAQAGAYIFPFGDRSNRAEFEAAMKKAAEGPRGVLYIYPPGSTGMGKMMGQQLAYFLFVNFMFGYIGHHAGLDGQSYLRVFQVIGAVAFMTHWVGSIPESIWFGRPWKSLWIQFIDAAIYAGVSAGTFGWLWP